MTSSKLIKSSGGFTIIELIISIFIMSVAIVGIYGAFSVINILTSDSADRLTGTYLAQEGMEIVRNIRDINWLNMDACFSGTGLPSYISCPSSWTDGLTNYASNHALDCSCTVGDCSDRGCEADATTGINIAGSWAMSPWAGRPLLNSEGFYNYSSGPQTKFKRRIIVNPVMDAGSNDLCGSDDMFGSNDNSRHIIKVIAQVSWDEKATILSPAVSSGNCCPDHNNPNCPANASNCITAEETLYDWYNYCYQ